MYKKCVPLAYFESIYDIPYEKYQKQGIKALFFDLDNTVISYEEDILTQNHLDFLKQLEKEFQIIFISNARKKRLEKALGINFPYYHLSKKPLKSKYKKALKDHQLKKEEALMIGDQLMTDIYGANRTGIKGILVKAVKRKSDHIFTRINRRIEKIMIKKIKKKNPEIYQERLEQYVKSY